MADNIKIVGSILNTQEISRYDDADVRLLTSQKIQEDFGKQNDYIEYFVYDAGGNLLNINYSYKDFKIPPTSFLTPLGNLPIIEIDPVKDLQNLGYSSGEFSVQYNFFNNKVSDSNAELFLKEISADRTEIRVGSTILTNTQIESATLALINEYTGSAYFTEYIINFGNNNQALAVNVALNKIESGYEILFKLYQSLPTNIQEKDSLWVVGEKINPYVFDINLDKLIISAPLPQLRGPNFGIKISNQNNVATSYQTYNSLINDVQNISAASYRQLLSLITSQSVDINTNYTDYTNFIFFSSAKQRVINFYNKVKQIEDYNTNIVKYTLSSSIYPNLINNLNSATASINNIIANFDGFEYYLYFESGSTLTSSLDYGITPYPKSGSALPYTLYPTGSTLASVWFNSSTSSADDYDDFNQNNLIYTLPSFIKDDDNNDQYITFINMVGNYFDNIWIYLQAVTDINLANNNLEQGVSKDLVYHVLQSLGTKLYNQYGDSDNTNFLIGVSGSSIFDNNFTYTGSYLNTIPRKDLLAESYKRIYHNLPLLMKTKGTAYGLQTLISTFGIPNLPYSTSFDSNNSASYYYTTSSAGNGITGSILTVKEYGGDLKDNTLDEFNNDKIRIVSSSIVTGSVLSPYISVVEYPTSSTAFRTNDLHYVDISFSPQDKIDIFTSASIVTTNPTWSLDNYIGDPRQLYNNSYTDLETERTTYLSPLTASIVIFTGSTGSGSIGATDYNSFIRLIQFFDNSLFKMLKDFVPARINLSTGVTISSPILERNKWSISNPSSTSKIDVNEGTISGPTIETEYTDIYSYLTGSKVAYYDGNLTGSYINTYAYFESSSKNPYLFPTSSLTTGSNVNSSLYAFNHSDFNVTLNNVSQSTLSRTRQDIQFVPGTIQNILSQAELQDSYESLKTHQLSRYDGVKISSLYYNTYTSASVGYEGDISFGKTAVIDYNVSKLGIFSEIVTNKFLPKRNDVHLKYLVDKEGNLTELNLRNKHWEEIQNTFKTNTTGSISQFNNQLYSNQKATDGEKIIFNSGYSYSPLLYFPSCSVVGGYNNISFQNQGNQSAYLTTAQNLNSSYYISGSSPLGYPVYSGSIYAGRITASINNIFNSPTETYSWYAPGNLTISSSYTVQETGQYKIYAGISMYISMSSGQQATWSLEMLDNGNVVENYIIQTNFTSQNGICYDWIIYKESGNNVFYNYTDCVTGDPIYNRRLSEASISICSRTEPTITSGLATIEKGDQCKTFSEGGNLEQILSFAIDRGYNNNNYYTATSGHVLSFRLKLVSISTSNYIARLISGGLLSIGSLAVSTGYSVVGCSPSYISSVASSSITFNSAISSFYNKNYIFVPNPASGSTSALYDEYGDVDYTFTPKSNDIIVVYLSDKSIVEYSITNVSINSNTGNLTLDLDSPLSKLAKTNLTSSNNQYDRFLLLSRQPDETNVITTFQKRDGKTSYGFLIPDVISSEVLNNIDTITKEVKQKLINDQPIINDINGGGF
jgi:hypothetical protein